MQETLHILDGKLRKAVAHMRYLPWALRLVWAAAPGWTMAWAGVLVAQGALPVATVYLTRAVVDTLVGVRATQASWSSLAPVLAPLTLLGLTLLAIELLDAVGRWLRSIQAERVQDYITHLIHTKAAAVDLAFYESPEYFDLMYRARVDASDRPLTLLESTGALVRNGITLVSMGAVLVRFGVWLPFALLVSTLPALYVVLRYAVHEHQWKVRATEAQRRAAYYDWVLTAGETAAELRLFHLAQHFQGAYRAVRERLARERRALTTAEVRRSAEASVAALLVTGASVVWVVWQALQGRVTFGDLVLFYQAFSQGQHLMRTLLQSMGQLYSHSLFVGNLFEFLALEPRVVAPLEPVAVPDILRDGIRFEHVSFHYPGNPRLALCDFSLDVPAGAIVALVGQNGAGKSTLLKLLCRFYDPDSGRIELDGTDLRALSLDELRAHMTVVFQEPVHYNSTVRENIALGDWMNQPTDAAVLAAAQAAGADEPIARLAQGYDTLLGKWFSAGEELSVGEWQRLALARAFLRQAPIMLLDEPTSAMDTWAEVDWMARYRTLAAGRTSLIITHRFTTAMHADIIHVMEDGKIVESGSHAQLLALGGRYAAAWYAQMRVAGTAELAP